MVIDIHRHFWRGVQRYYDADASPDAPAPAKPDWEATTRELVEEMDASGVDASVMLIADYGDRLGTPHFPVDQENRILTWARDRHPEKILAFYGIDPRRPSAPEKFERAIEEWEMAGIKLHATAGYFPHDRVCYPIYEICIRHDVPVLHHSGGGSIRCCTAASHTRWSSIRWRWTSRASR